jgi:hypothetical protein
VLASATALAPSESGLELPAVICSVPGCAGSAASRSMLVSSRIPSSRSKVRVSPLPAPATSTGKISRANRPESRAAAARWCERSANASISSRGISYLVARFCAVRIISMYASRASSAGLGGPPAPAHIVSSINTGPRGENGASPFISAQPDRLIDSTPAARPSEISPTWIECAMLIVAVSDDAQNRFTVYAGTSSGKPAASAAQRAMSPMPSWATLTQPAAISCTCSGRTPARSQPLVIASPSRSSVRVRASAPPYRPIAVRAPPRTQAS